MPALDNDRHEKFVQEVFSGKTATAVPAVMPGRPNPLPPGLCGNEGPELASSL
jgi:hypothetical protein